MEGAPVEFIAGLYLEQQELRQTSTAVLDSSIGGLSKELLGLDSILGVSIPGAVQVSRFSHTDVDAETYAVFGEVIWYATEDLRVSLGGRYSYQTKDVDKQLDLGSDATGGFNVASTAPGLMWFWGTVLGSFPHHLVDDRTESYFDPSIKLQYNLSFDEMIYFNYSQGHKSGGFNASDDVPVDDDGGTATASFEFEEEKAQNTEIGWKSVLAEGAVHFNFTIFHTKYEDLQVATFQGTTFAVGNAAEAKLMGTEIELRWAANYDLEIGGSLSYLSFKFENYENGACTAQQLVDWDKARGAENGCRQDLSGERSAFAPRLSGSVFADYHKPLGGELTFRTTIDLNFKSEMNLDHDKDPNVKSPGFGKVNARLALEAETWSIAAYGRNITDKQTYGMVNDIPLYSGTFVGWVEEPRVFGLEVSKYF